VSHGTQAWLRSSNLAGDDWNSRCGDLDSRNQAAHGAAAVARARILNGKWEMGNGKLVLSMQLESNVLPAFAAVSRRGIFLMVKSVIVL
jgi:hypothetical protein